MNTVSYELLIGLLRTTLFLSVAAGLAYLLLNITRCRSPRIHRIAWCAVLLQGWLLAQVPWTVAWTPPFLADEPRVKTSADYADVNIAGGFPEFGSTTSSTNQFPAALPAAPMTPEAVLVVIEQPPRGGMFEFLQAWWPIGVVAVWMIGIAVILVRGVWKYVRFVRHLASTEISNLEWQTEFDTACFAARIDKTISLFVTDDCGPLLCRRRGEYLLVVPKVLWQSLTSPQRTAIVQHELAHYRRGDLWKSLVVRLIALTHWFNPLAWFAVRRFDEAAEWTCDDLATSDRIPATEYASVLLKLCDGRRPQHAFLPAARGSSVSRRIRRLLAQTKEDSAMKKAIVCSVVAIILAIGMFRVELVGEEVAADVKPSRQVQEMIDAAKMAYHASQSAYDAGTITMDNLYVWSRHWLQSSLAGATNQKQRLDAYLDHRARMQQLFTKTSALYQGGSKGGEANKYHATKFYLAEAEVWLFDKFGKEFEPLAAETFGPAKEPVQQNTTMSINIQVHREFVLVHMKADGKELPRGSGAFAFDKLPPDLKVCFDLCKERGVSPDKVEISISASRETKFADVKTLMDACEQAGFKKIHLKTNTGKKEQADKQSQMK